MDYERRGGLETEWLMGFEVHDEGGQEDPMTSAGHC
jgi:hypothetical protein